MKKYVITGGAGFIGSHIAEYLSAEGHQIIVLDSLRTGFKKNLDDLNVQFEKGDIRDKNLVEELVQGANGIFHLAALVSVPESLLNIKECIDINTLGTINILEAAKKNHGCKVVLSSSAANYGDNPILPKIETMTPEPMTPYAVTKLDGEFYLKMYQDQWGLPTASLRYFNVFGPRQNPKSAYAAAVPIFINNALQNKPITIYGDGLQTRDFIYVKDGVHPSGLHSIGLRLRLGERNAPFQGHSPSPACTHSASEQAPLGTTNKPEPDVVKANILASQTGSEMYNVALGYSTSILELAERIIEITNSKSKIQFLEERSGDIKHSKADPSKFNALGFKPDYSIASALEETIDFYHQELVKT